VYRALALRIQQYGCPPQCQSKIDEGRRTFRFDAFGDQTFWVDTLKLHQAIEREKFSGVGPGVNPRKALAVGLKVDVDALPPALTRPNAMVPGGLYCSCFPVAASSDFSTFIGEELSFSYDVSRTRGEHEIPNGAWCERSQGGAAHADIDIVAAEAAVEDADTRAANDGIRSRQGAIPVRRQHRHNIDSYLGSGSKWRNS
jgi:hypothetical protein